MSPSLLAERAEKAEKAAEKAEMDQRAKGAPQLLAESAWGGRPSPAALQASHRGAKAAREEAANAMAREAAKEAARDRETFGSSPRRNSADDEEALGGLSPERPVYVPPTPERPPSGWLPPSDLVAAGGRVFAHELDMESLARQANSFQRLATAARPAASAPSEKIRIPSALVPVPPASSAAVAAMARAAQREAANGEGAGAANGGASGDGIAVSYEGAEGDDAAEGATAASTEVLLSQVRALQLRVAAEQQCVLREQHITARMWMEKAQAEERTEAALAAVAELEGQVAGWEKWHQSQRRQQRQRKQQVLQSPPEQMLHTLLAEWGVGSVQALKADERASLAAGLVAAANALQSGAVPPPPGLPPRSA